MIYPIYQPLAAERGRVSSGMRVKDLPLIATQDGIKVLPPQVACTLRGMGDLKRLWRDVLAPTLKKQKDALGRKVPERQIAYDVAQATGQDSSRSLLSMWFSGEREPTVSQFVALCRRLMLDPVEVLTQRPYASVPTHPPERKFVKSRNLEDIPQSKTKASGKAKARRVSHSK